MYVPLSNFPLLKKKNLPNQAKKEGAEAEDESQSSILDFVKKEENGSPGAGAAASRGRGAGRGGRGRGRGAASGASKSGFVFFVCST